MGSLTAGQVKTAYLKHLRAGLRERGFRGGPEGKFDRVREGGTDNFLIRLRAFGRGETKVDVLTLGMGVTIGEAEQEAADLRGAPVNPERVTLVTDLLAPGQPGAGNFGSGREALAATTLESAEQKSAEVLELIDEQAEPWWSSHRQAATVLDEMWASNRYHGIDALETMAVLARRLGRDQLVNEILAAHQADLDRRGADHPAFEPNRRWRDAFSHSSFGGE